EGARERGAIALAQIRIGIAQIQREHLVGEADSDVPGIIAWIGDSNRRRRDAIERIRCAEPLPPELARQISANPARSEPGRWCSRLCSDRGVIAPGSRIQKARRIELVGANCECFIDGPVDPGVALEKAEILLDLREIGPQCQGRPGRANRNAARKALLTLTARIEVAPDTEINHARTNRRAAA